MEGQTTLSIASFGPATLSDAKMKATYYSTRETNRLDDIEGSRPVNKYERFSQKYATIVPDDPSAIKAKPAIHSRNTRDMTLYVDDIEGTRCMVRDQMALTLRRVNPLDPDYKLSKFVPAEPVVPKFVRDEMYFDDIEGTRSKPLYKPYTRDILSVNDIEGSKPNWKPRHERVRTEHPPRDLLHTEDVSRKTHRLVDRTQRHTNMLDPSYTIHGTEIVDEAKYTKPKPLKQFIPDSHLLQTADIPGATAGWCESMKPRNEIRNTNNTADIEGAQADTFKHTISTKRQTHPLQPVYQDLDSGAPLPPIVAPLLPATLITRPNIRFPSTQRPASGTATTQSFSSQIVNNRDRPLSGNDMLSRSNGQAGNLFGNQGSIFANATAKPPTPTTRPAANAPLSFGDSLNFNMFQPAASAKSNAVGNELNFDLFQIQPESKSFATKYDSSDNSGAAPAINNFLDFGQLNFQAPRSNDLNLNLNFANASPRLDTSQIGRQGLGSARGHSAKPRAASSPRTSARGPVPTNPMGSGKGFGVQGAVLGIAERRAAQERQADIDAVRML